MRAFALLIVAVLVAAAGSPARAADADDEDGRPHPLRVLIEESMRRNEAAAHRRILRLGSDLAFVAATGRIDRDHDGVGEHGGLRDAAELTPVKDGGVPLPDAKGEAVVGGYVWRVVLPARDGRGVSETDQGPATDADPDAAEDSFRVYAWPERHGVTGVHTFVTDASGEVLVADVPAYSGRGRGPAPEAASRPSDDLPGVEAGLAVGVVGANGATWAPVSARVIGSVTLPPGGAPSKTWRDEAELAKALDAACATVEAELGSPIPGGRPNVRIATFAEGCRSVVRDLRPAHEALGLTRDQSATSARVDLAAMLMRYDATAHEVLVFPETIDLTMRIGSPDRAATPVAVRSLMIHEAIHAHDVRTWGLRARIDCVTSFEALAALGALIEGHAVFVGERIAAREGSAESLQAFPPWRPEIADRDTAAVAAAVAARAMFPYSAGPRFFRRIAAVGGAEAVERAMRDPPTRFRDIENPERWVRREAPFPSDDVLDAFESIGGRGPSASRTPVAVADLRIWLGDAADSVVEARRLHRALSQADIVLDVEVLVLAVPDAAGAVEVERAVRRCLVPEKVTASPVADGAQPGFVATWPADGQDTVAAKFVRVARLPGCVVVVTTRATHDGVPPASIENACNIAAAALAPRTPPGGK